MGKRGPKPKKNAIRRGGYQPQNMGEAAIIPAEPLAKPPSIAGNPTLSPLWDSLVGASPNFQESDVPLLASYVSWYAVFLATQQELIDDEGEVHTVLVPEDEDGNPNPYLSKPHPDVLTMQKATDMLMKLGDRLNLTPNARDRMNLVQAMTKSTQADIVSKTMDGYKKFKELSNADEPAGKAQR